MSVSVCSSVHLVEADQLQLGDEVDTGSLADAPAHEVDQPVHVGGGCTVTRDEEVRVFLRYHCAADAEAFQAAGVDEATGGVAGRVGEHRTSILAAGLVLAA